MRFMNYIVSDEKQMDNLKAYIKAHPEDDVLLEVSVSEFNLDKGNNLEITVKASAIEDLDKYIEQSVLHSYTENNVFWYALVYAEVGDMMWDWQDLIEDK